MNKVYIEHVSSPYVELMKALGYEYTENGRDADLFLFTGGADVSPSYYNHKKHPTAHNKPERDARELEIWESLQQDTPIVGICRGGQFLNVMCGGSMYQHIETGNHATGREHNVEMDGVSYTCSSTHHQMMKPTDEGEVLAVAPFSSEVTEWGDHAWRTTTIEQGVEVVLYRQENALCFQPHPEFYSVNHPCVDLFVKCLNELKGVNV